MPGQTLEKTPPIQLLKIMNRQGDLVQNASHQQLVRAAEDGAEEENREKSFRDVKAREWIVVAILCFVNLINYMDRFTLAGILVDIQKYFNINNSESGLLQTVFILSYMIFAPVFGYLGDRYSRRWIMASGVLLWSLTTLIGSFMTNFYAFLFFRAMVGIGEASYSTIAPTIISDLFAGPLRSKMLALFYFAIPVGCGLGYIIGSEMAKAMGSWVWGLRLTPALGVITVVLLVTVLYDPERGSSESTAHLQPTSWKEDLNDLAHNPSFLFSSAGFTCVSFVAGALSWWGPKFIEMGLALQSEVDSSVSDNVSYIFGVVSMLAGIAGVPLGSYIAQRLRPTYPTIDATLCGWSLLMSSPLVFMSLFGARYLNTGCYVLVFFAMLLLNTTWSIVADILLYVTLPTRRSTAEGFQLLMSHALGDAGSPFLIGYISEVLKVALHPSDSDSTESDLVDFQALQYALFTTCFVEIIGGLFFLITAFFIVRDKQKVEQAIHRHKHEGINAPENEASSLVS